VFSIEVGYLWKMWVNVFWVPNFGEFLPGLGIVAMLGEKFGGLKYLRSFQENLIFGDKQSTQTVKRCGHGTHFHLNENQIVI